VAPESEGDAANDLTDAQLLEVPLDCKSPDAKRAKTEALDVESTQGGFDKLHALIGWRTAGLMDTPEFKAAKRNLLGVP